MKFVFIFTLILFSINTFGSDKKYGAGFAVGSGTILSGEYKINESSHYDGALSFNLGNSKKLYLHASRVKRFKDSLKYLGQVFSWYYGLGARYVTFEKDKADSDYRIGPRASIGNDYLFSKLPLKLFAEAALTINLLPATNADVDVFLGARYYF